MTARGARRGGGAARYRAHPAAPTISLAPSVAGLYAVHAPAGRETRVYYCEPATGRCSCGGQTGDCSHIAAARALQARAARVLSLMGEVA